MIIRTTIAGLAAAIASSAGAQTVFVTGGQTNVLLDTALLASAANLNLSGVSGPVIAPGNLGADSVAFPINSRTGNLPTTFSYDPTDFLGSFGGTIEHDGSVLFNADAIEVGDLTIGFDNSRAGTLGGLASGFFVESTVGVAAILFDIGAPSQLDATDDSLTIGADLLVSPEFAAFLVDQGLASSNLEGADVGDALVEAVPAPGSAALLGLAGLCATRRRR